LIHLFILLAELSDINNEIFFCTKQIRTIVNI